RPCGAPAASAARADRRGSRAARRLGQTEAAEAFAAWGPLQVVLLLRVGAKCGDRSAHDRVLHADDRGCRAVTRRDLLERDSERDVVEPRAAPALGGDNAHCTELAQRTELLAGKVTLALP